MDQTTQVPQSIEETAAQAAVRYFECNESLTGAISDSLRAMIAEKSAGFLVKYVDNDTVSADFYSFLRSIGIEGSTP